MNGRGLDLRVRVPPGFDALEPALRDEAGRALKRGNVGLNLSIKREERARLAPDPAALDAAYGGYFTLARVFAKMIGNPTFMKQATKYGLPRQGLMRFMLKLMANLTEPRGGDLSDRIVNGLSRIAPDA